MARPLIAPTDQRPPSPTRGTLQPALSIDSTDEDNSSIHSHDTDTESNPNTNSTNPTDHGPTAQPPTLQRQCLCELHRALAGVEWGARVHP